MTDINKTKQGVSLQTLLRIFAVFGLLLITIIGCNLHTAVSTYKELAQDFDLHMDSHSSISALQAGSDNMTNLSERYVVTRDPDCMQEYFDIVDSRTRENACDTLNRYLSAKGYDDAAESLQVALNESNALMDTEIHAMKLITEASALAAGRVPQAVQEYVLPPEEETLSREQKLTRAEDLIFGVEYRQNKAQIDADIATATTTMSDKMEDDISDGMESLGHLITMMTVHCLLLAVLLLLAFALTHYLVLRPIQLYSKCIQENRPFELIGPRELKYLATTYNDMFAANEKGKQHTDYLLKHDTLTGASSKLAFIEQKKVLSQLQIPFGLLVFDIDHFKTINDTYGHEAGDQALIRVVTVVRSFLRSSDTVSRIGGDEFAAILMNITADSAGVLSEKLDKINQLLQAPPDGSPSLSLSIGVSFSENGFSEELFHQADQALYQAKANGRCGYSFYTESL